MSKKNFVSLILGTVGGTVNTKVGEIAGEVGMTPAGWNGGIFNMIRGLSETVIVSIAGIRLFRVADIVNGRFQRPLDRMRLCNCHISSSLSCISRISALYAPPPVLTRLAIWLMFRPMADRAAFIRLISVVSGWMIYPSIAIFRRYAPYRRVGSYAIFSSTSRFSSSVT